jgi:hypothetical protein
VFAMDACARVGVEVSAARASGRAVVGGLARGAVRELGFGGLVPRFGEYVGKRGWLAPPFEEYRTDVRPIAMLCNFAATRRPTSNTREIRGRVPTRTFVPGTLRLEPRVGALWYDREVRV